jgi:alpha-beta hydrolase superfamily lysophospholipase
MPPAAPTSTETPIERILTADGATVALRRRPADGPPVIFLHGLSVNADLWNLPDVVTPEYRYRSLARCMQDAGFDVHLVNWRGHGAPHMHSTPAPGQRDWCLDHFILYDLPAVVDHVVARRKAPPVIIAASMGSMSLAGYLEGARRVSDAGGERVVADQQLAIERQAALAGAVFTEMPATLRWPLSPYDERGRLQWQRLLRNWHRHDSDLNFPFELFSRSRVLQALVDQVGEIPTQRLVPKRRPQMTDGPFPASTSTDWQPASLRERFEIAAVRLGLHIAGTFTGGTHHRAEVMLRGRRYVMDHQKAGVLRQLTKCVRARRFVSAIGAPDLVYSDHYDMIELPTLVVQGGRDRIANPGYARTDFFDRLGAHDKTFRLYEPIAHGEIEAAPYACTHIYPELVRWCRERTTA